MRCHHHTFVRLLAVKRNILNEIVHTGLTQECRDTRDNFSHCIDAHRNNLVRTALCDEVVGYGFHDWMNFLRRY